jgi:hypothetical protein
VIGGQRAGSRGPRPAGLALCLLIALAGCGRRPHPVQPALPTIEDRVAEYGPGARARLVPFFDAAGVPYPPARFVLLGFKHERELHLLAAAEGAELAFIRAYPILGASGILGPKLRQGDLQVPEGIYAIEYLNPNSVAHLSLRVGYPNAYDLARAEEEGRYELGADIMIHGGWMSVGCLAIGDVAAEELFVLAADAGFDDAVVVLSPVDFRRSRLPRDYRAPTPWVGDLYVRLRDALDGLPLAPTTGIVTEVP